ncbi:hypothetical protein [Ralstonia mannitolilytica]|uniref:hypothetical protein n=1 Tax=Ralstonia mannitolilytica TaxID=105219 RepID=UPI001C95A8C8|nr:hypothetical protein [Ralstonia mannitolilytica]MBY4717529.1 hypothetical protein [Ralstonia mannitolilytica]
MTKTKKIRFDIEKVNQVVSDLKKNHEKVTISKVSKATGILYQTLYQSGVLDQYINRIPSLTEVIDAPKQEIAKISLPNTFDGYVAHIGKTYFQVPQSMVEVLTDLHEKVENFNHIMFRDVVNHLRTNKMIVQAPSDGSTNSKWITTQGKKGEVSFYLPFDELDGERSLRLVFPSDLEKGEKAKVFHLLQSVMKIFE